MDNKQTKLNKREDKAAARLATLLLDPDTFDDCEDDCLQFVWQILSHDSEGAPDVSRFSAGGAEETSWVGNLLLNEG